MTRSRNATKTAINLFRAIKSRYLNNFQYVKVHIIGVLGFVGFPTFYFVWNDLYPQPYENFWLRLVLAGLCSVFLFARFLPPRIFTYAPLYAYVVMTLSLPFFFTFMLLKNDANTVWLMSTICAVLYVILLFDTVNMVLVWFSGTVVAILCFYITSSGPVSFPQEALIGLPVFLFALAGGALLTHRDELLVKERENRMQTVAALGSSVAHEMRTPLASIAFDTQGLERKLTQTGQMDIPVMLDAVKRIKRHVLFANTTVDMLLVNVSQDKINQDAFTQHSMAATVASALERYPFKTHQKNHLNINLEHDFQFYGSDILMTHVVFNLTKNALRAIAAVNEGTISIHLEPGETLNRLIFMDTGTGIAPDILPHIFEKFFTASENFAGAGIGLALSKRVLESFMGSIECTSEYGKFTKFTVYLPNIYYHNDTDPHVRTNI